MTTVNQTNAVPTRKVTAAGLTSLFLTALFLVLEAYEVTLPSGAALVAVSAFVTTAVAYFTPNSSRDVVVNPDAPDAGH